MYEERTYQNQKFPKLKAFFNANNTSLVIFILIILIGIIVRIILWNTTSTDMNVWRDAAEYFLSGENPYKKTLESFQAENLKHFYAYFPLWLYISSIILAIFPSAWFFGIVKGLTLLFDLQVVLLFYIILKPKIRNIWRLRMPIAIWFVTPLILMTSSMHGKFDSLMFVFILLACKFHEERKFIPESIFLSFAILTKPIALMIVPFFFINDIKNREFGKFFIKIGILLLPIILMSIPFLNEPIIYIKGVIGVHITREHDMAPLFALLSLISSTDKALTIFRIIITSLIILLWLIQIIIAYVKETDIYKAIFFSFLSFNLLYWVFLVQYTSWIYTFYTIETTKSKMKNWQLITLSSIIIIVSTVLLGLIGAFVKHGL